MNHTLNILKRHPLSAAFPDMPQADYAELVADIQTHGLIQPVVLYEGLVLDGWHRYQASLDAGVKPAFTKFDGPDPVAFVLSLNMHRRHLDENQRAAAVVACRAWAASGDNQHTMAGGDHGAPPRATVKAMAEEAGVSERTIQRAKRAHEAGLGDAVRDGVVTAKEAAEIAKLPEPERQAALEAPPAPKKAEPKAVPLEAQEYVSKLEAEVAELKDQLAELADNMTGLQEELAAARRILDAEDLLARFDAEVKQVQAMNNTLKSRNFGLMDENNDLKGRLKSALRKIDRLEKAAKGAA